MAIIDIEELNGFGYFLSVYSNEFWLHSHNIDVALRSHSDFTYKELALKFGGYIDDSYETEEIFF